MQRIYRFIVSKEKFSPCGVSCFWWNCRRIKTLSENIKTKTLNSIPQRYCLKLPTSSSAFTFQDTYDNIALAYLNSTSFVFIQVLLIVSQCYSIEVQNKYEYPSWHTEERNTKQLSFLIL